MSLYSIIQIQKPWDPKLIWKEHNYNLFEAEILTVAAKIKVLVHTLA